MKWMWNMDKSSLINMEYIRVFEIEYQDKKSYKYYGKWGVIVHMTYGSDVIGYYDSKKEAIDVLNQIASGKENIK